MIKDNSSEMQKTEWLKSKMITYQVTNLPFSKIYLIYLFLQLFLKWLSVCGIPCLTIICELIYVTSKQLPNNIADRIIFFNILHYKKEKYTLNLLKVEIEKISFKKEILIFGLVVIDR